MAIPIRREPPPPERARAESPVTVTRAAPTPAQVALSRPADLTLLALRVMSALMLAQHGVGKLFGLLLPPDRPFAGAPDAFSRSWVAGVLEIAGGVLLALGLFTRPVAFVLSGLMAAAYFIAHAGDGFWPILNGGELAALYCFVFLALWGIGGGRYALDALRRRR